MGLLAIGRKDPVGVELIGVNDPVLPLGIGEKPPVAPELIG